MFPFISEPSATYVPPSNVEAQVELPISTPTNLIPEDDGLDDLLSQVDVDVLLSQVQNVEISNGKTEVRKEASTMNIASKSKHHEKVTKMLEVMNLQNCSVNFNF